MHVANKLANELSENWNKFQESAIIKKITNAKHLGPIKWKRFMAKAISLV